jgi:hypothetical protein
MVVSWGIQRVVAFPILLRITTLYIFIPVHLAKKKGREAPAVPDEGYGD